MILKPPPEEWRPVLKRGVSDGPDVGAWQRVLMHQGYDLSPFGDDENFGALTEKQTIRYQLARGLEPDGEVDKDTRATIGNPPSVVRPLSGLTKWPFMQAAGWTWANRSSLRLVVVHTMETGETLDTAEAVAAWFAGKRGKPPKASAHACVDGDSLVRCVRPEHVAWAAPGSNRDGYQVEHAGRARQSAEDWADQFSSSMLEISAEHVAVVIQGFGWAPHDVRKLSVAEVADKSSRGFCGHFDVTRAFRKSDHIDPGPHFPWDFYLDRVRANMTVG